MNDRITELEEQVAHLTKTVEELSDVLARHDLDMERITRRLAMLMEREVERDADGGGSIPLGDQRPPHW